ncbi:NAD-dependent epimerase/dehydratase family protein [Kiloniella laminariae]|uniref:NAD-dependent epimerase/dehydratase family protein n=1 Tax=Kiloniella laminariae TaxID=454162 RepID=UPI0003602B85|nr:NAD-dependent epimerase/dehydratase family protein [Kiloniella laminariae]
MRPLKPVSVVTGGAGFIGSHMVDLLVSEGHIVRVIDNLSGGRIENLVQHTGSSQLIVEEKDIIDLDANDRLFSEVDNVFHFAGIGDIVPSIETPVDYMNINVQGTVKVLEAARNARIKRFVYAASSSCYGLANTPTSETAAIELQYPYALSKYLGELAAFHWQKVYGLSVNSVCIFNAYGTRSRTTGAYGAVFGVFLRQKLAGHPFTVVGDGTQSRDFVYVTDVARAFLAAAECVAVGERFNVGSGNPRTISTLVELLGGSIKYIPWRKGEPKITHADISKIKTMTDWEPTVSFEEGVQMILSEIDYWKEAPLWTVDRISKATEAWHKYLS